MGRRGRGCAKIEKDRNEQRDLARRLRELHGNFESKRGFSKAEQAAQILVSMLRDWKLAGAVWYLPKTRRFRLVGENYAPERDEVQVGVYLPDVKPEDLMDDLEAVLNAVEVMSNV